MDNINNIAVIIRNGGIGVFPTDTVYAIGCSALDDEALKRLYEIRRRPQNKPLLIHIAGADQLSGLVRDIPPTARQLINKYWPGPLTLIFKRNPDTISNLVSAGLDTVAVRWPDCQIEIELIKQAGTPLVAPSANPSGETPALNISQARQYFGNNCDFYLDNGTCSTGQVSTILDISKDTPILLRSGRIALSAEEYMIK
ncbi:MAG: L-threonylcarbamoyladenylate synthase [Candidatus Margulisiibacteriota bacterium]